MNRVVGFVEASSNSSDLWQDGVANKIATMNNQVTEKRIKYADFCLMPDDFTLTSNLFPVYPFA